MNRTTATRINEYLQLKMDQSPEGEYVLLRKSEVENIIKRIEEGAAELEAAKSAIRLGGHLRPGSDALCGYLGSPCNKCGFSK